MALTRKIPVSFAILAVDPGTTSGVAAGLFHPTADIKSCISAGDWEAWEVDGSPAEQAWQIMDEYRDRQAQWNAINGVALPDTHLVCESFALRLKKAHGAGSDQRMLDPVRVASAMEALALHIFALNGEIRPWVKIEYQLPSAAKKYVTNERMRRWGAWVKGSEHKRDAMRHMIKKISDTI
jgi:hypothetical protein